ncbi:MAG: hypothetical protein N3A53_05025, partial [Verrucomicrobiae bacterium]|nr:hypothetical protein [Verrucomicrobiae bacterium]
VMWRWLSRRERWVLIVSVVLAGFTLHQLRWESFSVVPLVTLAGLVARVITQSHPVWLPALVFVATLPAWGTIAIVQKQSKTLAADPMMGPHATKFALTAVSQCLGERHRGAVVLAGWDHGAVLAGLGQVRVIGSAYWSNLDGLYAGHELLTTADSDRFHELARRRQVQWLLVPGFDRFRWDIEQAFLVLHGRLPTSEEVERTVAWQTAKHRDMPRLNCEQLSRIAPGWQVIQLAEP